MKGIICPVPPPSIGIGLSNLPKKLRTSPHVLIRSGGPAICLHRGDYAEYTNVSYQTIILFVTYFHELRIYESTNFFLKKCFFLKEL